MSSRMDSTYINDTLIKTFQSTEQTECHAGFLSSRPNWVLCPPLHPQASVPPPPLLGPREGHICLRERGLGVPIRAKGQTLQYSRYCIIPFTEYFVLYFHAWSKNTKNSVTNFIPSYSMCLYSYSCKILMQTQ